MGGGSADAAAALRLASAVTEPTDPTPNLRPEELDLVATSLGSDVPSQLVSGVAVGTGAGDLAERFEPLAPHAYVVLPAGFPLATATVYAEADRLGFGRPAGELRDLYAALIARWSPAAGRGAYTGRTAGQRPPGGGAVAVSRDRRACSRPFRRSAPSRCWCPDRGRRRSGSAGVKALSTGRPMPLTTACGASRGGGGGSGEHGFCDAGTGLSGSRSSVHRPFRSQLPER